MHYIEREIKEYKNSFNKLKSYLIIIQNAVSNDIADISFENIIDNLKMVINYVEECIENTNRKEQSIVDDGNFEELRLNLDKIYDCMKILEQALLCENCDLQYVQIESLISMLIEKVNLIIEYANELFFVQFPNL